MLIPDGQPRTTPRFAVGPVQVLAFVTFLLALSLPLAAVALAGNSISGPLAATAGLAQVADTPTSTPTATATATPTPTGVPLSATPTASSTPTAQSYTYLPFVLKGWPPPTATPTPSPTATPTVVYYIYMPMIIKGWPVPTPTPTRTPPPISQGDPGFAYGIQAHMLWDDRDMLADHIVDLGLSWVKQQVRWSDVEPSRGDYRFDELAKVVASANAKGIRVLFSVVRTPEWALPGNWDSVCPNQACPPTNLDDFTNFMGALADRFKDRGMAYEIWNEQNLVWEWKPIDPCRYTDMYKRAYDRIVAVDRLAMVITGGLTPTDTNDPNIAIPDRDYLRAMFACPIKPGGSQMAVGAHPSGYNNPPDVLFGYFDPNEPSYKDYHSFFFRDTMEDYRKILMDSGKGGRRIWITEFGWAVGTPLPNYGYAADNTEEERAAWVVKAYQMSKDWGYVGVATLWNLNFRIVAPGSEQALFGILEHDWAHTSTYNALRDMSK